MDRSFLARSFRSALVPCAVAAAAAVLAAAPSFAAPPPKQFIAVINAGQETPPVASGAFGVAHLTLTEPAKELCYSISFSGLSSAEIVAHIHGPAQPGVPGGIVFNLPLGNPKNGCVATPLTSQQKAQLLKNQLYINIHTVNFGGGEIRGQILRIK